MGLQVPPPPKKKNLLFRDFLSLHELFLDKRKPEGLLQQQKSVSKQLVYRVVFWVVKILCNRDVLQK